MNSVFQSPIVIRWMKILAVLTATFGLLVQFVSTLDIRYPFRFTDTVYLYDAGDVWVGVHDHKGPPDTGTFIGTITFGWLDSQSGSWAPTTTIRGNCILWELQIENEFINSRGWNKSEEALKAEIEDHPEIQRAIDTAIVTIESSPTGEFTRAQALTAVHRLPRPIGYLENILAIVMLGVVLCGVFWTLKWFFVLFEVPTIDPTKCAECGYSNIDLPTPTCPECGTPRQ